MLISEKFSMDSGTSDPAVKAIAQNAQPLLAKAGAAWPGALARENRPFWGNMFSKKIYLEISMETYQS